MQTIYSRTHSPVEHFGSVGHEYLAANITDWEGCPNEDAPLAEHRADLDNRVLRLLLADAPTKTSQSRSDEAKEQMVTLAGKRIGWQRALPELKCWAGQATLLSIVAARAEALQSATPDKPLLDWQIPLKTCSGIDARCAPTGRDVGFSVAALAMPIYTYVAAELLAILGMGISPIVRYGYREYGYVDPDGQWWSFRVVEREGYHRCYTMSKRVGINGGP